MYSHDTSAFVGIMIVMVLFGIIIGFIPVIFYLLTLQNTLKAVSQPNQKMVPAQVWLLLIPFFGIVWHFIVVHRMAESIRAELATRGQTTNEDNPAYSLGLAMCICQCCCLCSLFIPALGWLFSLAYLVLWIIYWVRVSAYKRELLSPFLPQH